jgi:hypothetical protein
VITTSCLTPLAQKHSTSTVMCGSAGQLISNICSLDKLTHHNTNTGKHSKPLRHRRSANKHTRQHNTYVAIHFSAYNEYVCYFYKCKSYDNIPADGGVSVQRGSTCVCVCMRVCVWWCGVVWCGVVWCGVVWCGVVWYGVVCVCAASGVRVYVSPPIKFARSQPSCERAERRR